MSEEVPRPAEGGEELVGEGARGEGGEEGAGGGEGPEPAEEMSGEEQEGYDKMMLTLGKMNAKISKVKSRLQGE